MTDSRPDTAKSAGRFLEVEVVATGDRGARQLAQWAKSIVKATVLNEPEGVSRVELQLRDLSTGAVVYTQSWGGDLAGAEVARRMVETDLEQLDVLTFLRDYSIEWKPEALA